MALLTIFVDHVRGNPWNQWTLRGYGLMTALDVFILLAGVSGYLAWGTRLGSRWADSKDVLRQLGRRIVTVYGAQLGLVASLLVLAAVVSLLWPSYPVLHYLRIGPLVHDPLPTGLGVLTLSFQPLFCGILPVYVLLLPTLPLVVWGLRRSWLLPLGVGVVMFAVAGFGGLGLSAGTNDWRIDPMEWFVVYAAGIVLGSRVGRAPARLAPRWYTWLALGWLVVTLLDDAPWQAIPTWHDVPAPTVVLGLDLHAQPWTEPLGLLSLAAAVWLVLRWVPREAGWLGTGWARAINRIGAASLPMFWLGAVLSAAGTILADRLGASFAAYTLVTVVGIAVLLWAARLREIRSRGRSAVTTPVTITPT
jgi:hypothetical protein